MASPAQPQSPDYPFVAFVPDITLYLPRTRGLAR
jgi:hypothetical protein